MGHSRRAAVGHAADAAALLVPLRRARRGAPAAAVEPGRRHGPGPGHGGSRPAAAPAQPARRRAFRQPWRDPARGPARARGHPPGTPGQRLPDAAGPAGRAAGGAAAQRQGRGRGRPEPAQLARLGARQRHQGRELDAHGRLPGPPRPGGAPVRPAVRGRALGALEPAGLRLGRALAAHRRPAARGGHAVPGPAERRPVLDLLGALAVPGHRAVPFRDAGQHAHRRRDPAPGHGQRRRGLPEALAPRHRQLRARGLPAVAAGGADAVRRDRPWRPSPRRASARPSPAGSTCG